MTTEHVLPLGTVARRVGVHLWPPNRIVEISETAALNFNQVRRGFKLFWNTLETERVGDSNSELERERERNPSIEYVTVYVRVHTLTSVSYTHL